MFDMATRDRLKSGHGNAILVSGSIYQACRFFELFEEAGLKGHCAIVTSYRPSPADIKGEETGEGLTEKLRQYDIYRRMLADHFDEPEDAAAAKVELFEDQVKERFIKQPGQMKLLIVVDKLLTGFDAPPATYLYIDKEMHDHGLFQAICRVNRLHGEDKEYGYIIDYKDLFKSLDRAIRDYTGGAFEGYDAADVAGLLTDRLEKGRERLAEVRESIKALCDPVAPPRDTEAYIGYFVGTDPSDPELVKGNEPKRVQLYKLAPAFLRAYANLANEMSDAGYTDAEAAAIKAEVEHYEKVRQEVKLASADYIDMKMYEPAMRHLLDTYIRAEESKTLSTFDDLSLVELLVQRGEAGLDALPPGIKSNRDAMAETIENNVRKVIIEANAVNPKYYDTMSELLEAVIRQRKREAIAYEDYLERMVELAKKVKAEGSDTAYPATLTTGARRSFYDNLDKDADLAIRLDEAIRAVKKADWRGNRFKEREVRNAIVGVVGGDEEVAQKAFELAVAQHEY
jgi:type I restriction enzyme R subunit